MKTAMKVLLFPLVAVALLAQRPWQQITVPSVGDAAANFKTPPREYGAIHWAIWGGELTKERIVSELDSLVANGVYIINFGPSQHMTPKYFSPEHLALIKFGVEEAAKRGMKVWIADEGSYPSGFAGGLISKEYPQLAMQGIVADTRVSVAPDRRFRYPRRKVRWPRITSTPRARRRLCPSATDRSSGLRSRRARTARSGRWKLVIVRHVYRSSPRAISIARTAPRQGFPVLAYRLPGRGCHARVSQDHARGLQEDVRGPVRQDLLGFFGDEPDYTGFIPWTPKLLDEFRRQKGYDVQPYLPLLFAPKMTDQPGA